MAVSLEGLAAIAMARQPGRAAWLYGAAAELRARCGGEVEPFWWGRTPATSADLQAVLGEAAFAEAHDGGKHASLDDMVEMALREDCPTPGRSPGLRGSWRRSARYARRAPLRPVPRASWARHTFRPIGEQLTY